MGAPQAFDPVSLVDLHLVPLLAAEIHGFTVFEDGKQGAKGGKESARPAVGPMI